MRHIAILRSGGKVEITLPLRRPPGGSWADIMPPTWRQDENGILINLAEVAAIVGSPEPARQAEELNAPRLEHAFRSYAGGKYCAAIVGPHDDRHTCSMPPQMHPGS